MQNYLICAQNNVFLGYISKNVLLSDIFFSYYFFFPLHLFPRSALAFPNVVVRVSCKSGHHHWSSSYWLTAPPLANQSKRGVEDDKPMQVGITGDPEISKMEQNLQNGVVSLPAKTFTIDSGFSQLLLTYISK